MNSNNSKNIDQLIGDLTKELRTISTLGSVGSVLGWDQETMMPAGAIEFRAEQSSLIAGLSHERHTGKAFERLLAKVVDLETGDVLAKVDDVTDRMLRTVHKDWKKSRALPQEFVEKSSRLFSQSQNAWDQAKQADDYSLYQPYLEQVIELTRRRAEYFGYEESPYDALLDEYEPGMTTAMIKPIFSELRDGTIDLLKKLEDSGHKPDVSCLAQDFDEDKQWEFGICLLKTMGYDFNHGRQDRSAHPFSTGFHPHDVRVTTRICKDNLIDGFLSTAHEGGHALYEQGLPAEFYGTPRCESTSLGIHESQSRLWENFIGRSAEFWRGNFSRLQKTFPGQLDGLTSEDFYRAIHEVKSSMIRTQADEVTYNLHVMIRFEIEQEMINGRVDVAELPDLWNDKYEAYLGIRPQNNAEGILQDVHWSMGAIGYFPTYSLGNLYCAQFYEAIETALPSLEQDIQSNNFTSLLEWLRENIHRHGRTYEASELVERICGQPLSAQPFLNYLNQKYAAVYQIP